MLDNYEDVISVDEFCDIIMVGRNQAYKILNSGCLGAFRIGRCWKIPKTAVIDFLQKGQSIFQGT